MRPAAPRAASEPAPAPHPVSIDDAQDTWPVDDDRWRSLVVAVLGDLGVPRDAEVALSFVTPAAMAELNETYMGHAGPTDVLSFPIDGDESATAPGGPPLLLGDVVICPEVAATNGVGHAGSYEDEIALLVVHGLLHLLGMDHAADDERDAMQGRERDLLARFHGPLARDPWSR